MTLFPIDVVVVAAVVALSMDVFCAGVGSKEADDKRDNRAVGSDVNSAADQIASIISFACTFGILKRIGYIMAMYLSIEIATIVYALHVNVLASISQSVSQSCFYLACNNNNNNNTD